jgi:hypothetical protein
MDTTIGDRPDLEMALLRRSLGGLAETIEHCDGCHRAMLIGERVYEYDSGEVRCALCQDREVSSPADSHTVHGPAFGHSIRVLDRRVSKRAA